MKRRVIISIVATIASLAMVAMFVWWLWKPSEATLAKSVAVVERTGCYLLEADGRPLLALGYDTLYTPAVWANRYALFPSCKGRLATPIVGRRDSMERWPAAKIQAWARDRLSADDSTAQSLRRQAASIGYYLKVHGVQDEGYHEIARHAQRLRSRLDNINATDSVLRKALASKAIGFRRHEQYHIIYNSDGKQRKVGCAIERARVADGYLLLRAAGKTLPKSAKAVSLWLWVDSIPQRMLFTQYGDYALQALSHPHITSSLALGRNCPDTIPHGYTGYWISYRGDSVSHAGWWKNGRRAGKGIAYLAHRRRIQGLYAADTLYYGSYTDAQGHYRGEMDRHGTPMGHGTMADTAHTYYEGTWKNGLRDGFGFAVGHRAGLRIGEWAADRYKGERMVYNSDRIYGIDISKYQHKIGRKTYPIHWNSLRVTHLGTLSKKRISGRVDYPVSFVYIKSTEGTTVSNPFYNTDYQQARKRGIRVGSYHFFSTTSAADKQARHFIRRAKFAKGDLPPVLDVEPSHQQIRKMGGAGELWRRVAQWLAIVERHTGVKPVLYISQTFVKRYLPYAPDIKQRYPVWIARYGEYKPDVHLSFWQLSPDGKVNGITGDVDINVFNGYRSEFQSFINTATIK